MTKRVTTIAAGRRRASWLLLFTLGVFAPVVTADIPELARQAVREAVSDRDAPAMAVVALRDGKPWFEVAAGLANPDAHIRMTVDTPVRIASVTKPYVAATLLILADQRQLPLDMPIAGLLSPQWQAVLRDGGYDPLRITLDHLLTHSAGFPDHADSWRYKLTAFLDKDREWKALEQLELMTAMGDPLFEPGTEYHYSDTGYVVLGEIITNLVEEPLSSVVRRHARFAALGLSNTWWERFEQAPGGAAPRARQYIYGFDVTDINATTDLFGGGGLLASTRDMAAFFAALFGNSPAGGSVFQQPQLQAQMLTGGVTSDGYSYHRGVVVFRRNGTLVYSHGGFWGTAVNHYPEHGITIAITVTERSGREAMYQLLNAAIDELEP
ncbi:MAG: serine hydrolase domain-containing protein [Halioglobus sp.]